MTMCPKLICSNLTFAVLLAMMMLCVHVVCQILFQWAKKGFMPPALSHIAADGVQLCSDLHATLYVHSFYCVNTGLNKVNCYIPTNIFSCVELTSQQQEDAVWTPR